MPTYLYHCPKCGDFELKQSIEHPALTRCPNCEGKVTRVPQPTPFIMKEK